MLATVLLAASAGLAHAQPIPTASSVSPGMGAIERRLNDFQASAMANGQVVSLPFRNDASTPIYMRVTRTTTLQFQADEKVTDVMYDDREALEDYVTQDARRLTIRLKRLTTVPATVVTSKRSYFLVLTPTDAPNTWYQGVSFSAGEGRNPFGIGSNSDGRNVTVAEAMPTPPAANDLFTGTPNFSYSVSGDANFKPVAVYDNGRFTWVQMPANLQTMPAVFEVGPNGLEVVNYVTQNNGTAILINRLMPRFVLKLGASEVSVTANR